MVEGKGDGVMLWGCLGSVWGAVRASVEYGGVSDGR